MSGDLQPYYQDPAVRIYHGDALETLRRLPEAIVQTVVTSPPYWRLRDYGVGGQLGLEATPEEFVANMVAVFRGVRRVLRDDGTVWLNMGDSYAAGKAKDTYNGEASADLGWTNEQSRVPPPGLKQKDLCGIPWMLAFALRVDGWYLRQDIIWHKPNPMPESVTDRCTKAHEYIFLLSKSPRYFFDAEAIREAMVSDGKGGLWGADRSAGATPDDYHVGAHDKEPWTGERSVNPAGRNRRSVWTVATHSFAGCHFATFPPKLIEPCILAGTSNEGACAKCGAPWRRVVEKERVRTRPGKDSKSYDRTNGEVVDDGMEKPWRDRAEIGNRDPGRHVTETTTTGWEPSCDCNADKVPCVVLDPFLGAGTTAMVAKQNGRHAIGIELNAEYIELALPRIAQGVLF